MEIAEIKDFLAKAPPIDEEIKKSLWRLLRKIKLVKNHPDYPRAGFVDGKPSTEFQEFLTRRDFVVDEKDMGLFKRELLAFYDSDFYCRNRCPKSVENDKFGNCTCRLDGLPTITKQKINQETGEIYFEARSGPCKYRLNQPGKPIQTISRPQMPVSAHWDRT